jgi:hypothetical protein
LSYIVCALDFPSDQTDKSFVTSIKVCVCVRACVFSEEAKQGVTNTRALPKNVDVVHLLTMSTISTPKNVDVVVVHLLTMSTLSNTKKCRCCCTSTYYVHTLNTFSKETSSNKVKLPKVGSNAIVPVHVEAKDLTTPTPSKHAQIL